MGRKRIYQNAAERENAYREKHYRLDLLIAKNLGETLDEICARHNVSRNTAAKAMLKFALTNHDWKSDFLFGLAK
jgi:hypothetical protein